MAGLGQMGSQEEGGTRVGIANSLSFLWGSVFGLQDAVLPPDPREVRRHTFPHFTSDCSSEQLAALTFSARASTFQGCLF